MNIWLVAASIAFTVFATGIQAAGNAENGQAKSVACGACHGQDGNSANAVWPKLAGQHPKYIEKQLMDFKNGLRNDPLMGAQATGLNDQDMADLAAYFSSQKITENTAAPDSVEAGEKMYRAGNAETGVAACMACHGPAGSGNPQANFPALAGQHADYLAKTLKDFRSNVRANDAGKMMQDVTARMSDQEINAVAQYIQGLRN